MVLKNQVRFICRLHNGITVLNPYTQVRFI